MPENQTISTPPAVCDSLNKERALPELLAPAGDWHCAKAAVENGADAIYFGLEKFNARMRAHNFTEADLPRLMEFLHLRGVRGYVTFNTLVFPDELKQAEQYLKSIIAAGVDAAIVQDIGICRLIRRLSPDFPIHASTQMTVTSPAGVEFARELGCNLVVLARECSLKEIATIHSAEKKAAEKGTAGFEMPLEVFVHGALCVAYSGQCLTSEALGGRSANRGECAQACRMPYEVVCDGKDIDLGKTQYLLSPQDLAAYDLIPRLIELGVASVKIEGRLKAPEYVANITRHYRQAIDAAWAGRPVEFTARDVEEMQLSFSRGFSHGFLDGNDHKVLVRGDYAKKRGIFVGRVEAVTAAGIRLVPATAVKRGDGMVREGDEDEEIPEQGGRIYEVVAGRAGRCELRLGRESLDL